MRILILAGLFFLFTFSFMVGASRNSQAKDSPWLEITEEARKSISAGKTDQLEKILAKKTPSGFWNKLENEAQSTPLIPLWGKSINFDEAAKGIIVAPEILDLLFAKFKTPARDGRVVHAGVEHVYGYLFSNLQTPYGYKRARWLDGDIERGFNLSASVLSPLTQEGSLLSNVSAFFGRIALGQNPERLSVLDRDSNAAGELKQFNYARLKWKRLVEMTSLSDGTQITLQSDLVPFTHERAINAALLIYSVSDSREDGPKLISGFPVSEAFMANALDPSKLGSDQNITTRYNIYVPGFNGTLKGKREVLTIHE